MCISDRWSCGGSRPHEAEPVNYSCQTCNLKLTVSPVITAIYVYIYMTRVLMESVHLNDAGWHEETLDVETIDSRTRGQDVNARKTNKTVFMFPHVL